MPLSKEILEAETKDWYTRYYSEQGVDRNDL